MKSNFWNSLAVILLIGCFAPLAYGQSPVISFDKGAFKIEPNARGESWPDFSYCGYRGNDAPVSDVSMRIELRPTGGDDTQAIQRAIDSVAALPVGADGWRGAVVLSADTFYVSGAIRLYGQRIVLRGTTVDQQTTTIIAVGRSRRALIQVGGNEFNTVRSAPSVHDTTAVDAHNGRRVTDFVPIGSRTLKLSATQGLKVGQTVKVRHKSSDKWISAVGMNRMPTDERGSWLDWKAGTVDQAWLRTITKIDGQTIEVDVPLTNSLDPELTETDVTEADALLKGWGEHLGIENLRLISRADIATNPKDEEHAWDAVRCDRVQNAWVRGVRTQQFVGSSVLLGWNARFVTVSDCASSQPVSESAAWRRQTFLTYGQQSLFLRCQAEDGRHDFAVGYLSSGPNAFSYCQARRASHLSGPLGFWSTGVLYDNVTMDGAGLALTNRETEAQGAGWSAANSVLWNCVAPQIVCRQPPTAFNWAVGVWGEFTGDGYWKAINEFVNPDSLIKHQLTERIGKNECEAILASPKYVAPSPLDIKALALPDAVKARLDAREDANVDNSQALQVKNGWLTIGDRIATGSRQMQAWWRGATLPAKVGEFGPGLLRFVPGIDERNMTDSIQDIADQMKAKHSLVLEQHWGLWYDRRRDDHQMVRRANADAWAPFYELPWARSGQGQAWDGLSKYDLTRYNSWYFDRLAGFANAADERGLVLMASMYFQHNILEAGAHWADFPWRPANSTIDTGFPEPPVYQNRKRVFMADAFYDVSHAMRRELHTQYIRHCLDVLGRNQNVLFLLSEEYTGPAHFAEFWLRTIDQWEHEHKRNVLVVLSTTRDVQEQLLSQPELAAMIDGIDVKYWWPTRDGQLYDPVGGQNLAPRQQLREWKGSKAASPESLARGVREIRLRYPNKFAICSVPGADPWLILAAGGSIVDLPSSVNQVVLKQLVNYVPVEISGANVLGELHGPGAERMVVVKSGTKVENATEIQAKSGYQVMLVK